MSGKGYKPGPGWHHVAGAVWDHDIGLRIHVYGTCVAMQDGKTVPEFRVDGTLWPERQRLDKYIQIAGGNRRRGVMSWALSPFVAPWILQTDNELIQ